MSDSSNEEKLPSSADQYDFDDELYEVFMEHLAADFDITQQEEIAGGLSGARTSSIRIDGHGQAKMGQYILKVCLSEKAEKEILKHSGAKASIILGRYVPKLITYKSYPNFPLTGILYQIAGGGQLARTTFQQSLMLFHFPAKLTERLARTMLGWNLESNPIVRTADLLGSIQEGLGDNRLPALIERLKDIVDYPDRPRLDLIDLGVWRYNPVHYLISHEVPAPLHQMSQRIPIGMLHRDLHPGNVIIAADNKTGGSFQVIDFAASGPGNAFFDLAYLEISILLNSFSGGFHSITELRRWWYLEEYLVSDPYPPLNEFSGVTEALWRVLPIRHALNQRMKKDNFRDDYWVAFLVASVEAGLDLTRKIQHQSRRRVAFLTAVSRFHYLIEKVLKANEKPPQGEESLATIYGLGEEPPTLSQVDGEEKRVTATKLGIISTVREGRDNIELVWPGEVNRCTSLYDPWQMVDEIRSTLTGESDQGVLLIGERRFGKSSFWNCVSSLFPREEGEVQAVRLETLGTRHSAQSFAKELLNKICQSVGLSDSPVAYDIRSKEFDSTLFFTAFQSIVDKKKPVRFVVCIDEIDSTIKTASSTEDAKTMLQLLSQLLTHPNLPVRLLLTATSAEVFDLLRRYRSGTGFVENLGIWKIQLCSEFEMRELIERFSAPVTFDEEAFNRIFMYSGGQIYFVKLVVRLAIEASRAFAGGKEVKKSINAQSLDNLMHEVITPTSNTLFSIRNIHESVFDTMRNIYPMSFSKEEQQFMQLLTQAHGTLRASSLQMREAQLVNNANRLYQRGYVSKAEFEEEEDEVYIWRIGIWQLFLENHYQLKYYKSHGKK